jgi:hypothetical protein
MELVSVQIEWTVPWLGYDNFLSILSNLSCIILSFHTIQSSILTIQLTHQYHLSCKVLTHVAVHSLICCQCTICNNLEPVKYLILRKISALIWHYQYFQCFFIEETLYNISYPQECLPIKTKTKERGNWRHTEITPVLQTAEQKSLWYLKWYSKFCMVFQNV